MRSYRWPPPWMISSEKRKSGTNESEAEDVHGMRLGLDHAKRRVTWGREVDARRAFEKVRQGR